MKEKLALAKKLRISCKNFSKNKEYVKMFSKCYRTYAIECILKGKDTFQLIFKAKYIQHFPERLKDYCNYALDTIYRFYLVHITPNDDSTLKKYELIHYGVSIPVHVKVNNTPDEYVLSEFLKENGLKIVEEHLDSEAAIYDIAKV